MPNVDRIPPLVDVDAHIVEPPDVWSSRLPAQYREIDVRGIEGQHRFAPCQTSNLRTSR